MQFVTLNGISVGLFDEDGKCCRLVQQKGKLVATLGSKGVLSFLEILYLMDASKLALFKITEPPAVPMTLDEICDQGIPISFQQLLDQHTSYRDLHLFHVFKYLRNMGYHCLLVEGEDEEEEEEEFDFKVYAPSASFKKSCPATKPIKLIKVITEDELKSTSFLKRILARSSCEKVKDNDTALCPFITLALTQGNQISFVDLEPQSFTSVE